MALYVGEAGKTIRLNAAFDMSGYTEINFVFEKPDGTTVTKATADGVSIGSADVTDDDIGALTAYEYAEYSAETGLLDQSGTWKVYIKYTNTSANPDHIYIGSPVNFQVNEAGGC